MSMCRVFSYVVGRGCFLWPVHSFGKTVLAFALLHFVLQGQICLLLQVFLDFLLVMLKILQARHQQYMNRELPDVQAGFRKGRRTRDQVANICWIIEKEESSRKTSISALLTMPKPLTVWITINCGKFWKRWAYQTTWPASWEICMQVRMQQNWT